MKIRIAWLLWPLLAALLVLAELTRADPFVTFTACGTGPRAGNQRVIHISAIEAFATHPEREDCVRIFLLDGRTVYVIGTMDEMREIAKEHQHGQ